MPRQRTDKVERVKAKLVHRLAEGLYRPGDRFLSARAVAERYAISYQTAHRLLAEMCQEGSLERRPQSGTYVPGGVTRPIGAQLVFADRARRRDSFGAKLLAKLTAKLDTERIDWKRTWVGPNADAKLAADRIPVLWETPATLAACIAQQRPTVLLDDRPPFGLGALFVDSVSQDDYGGGVMAGRILRDAFGDAAGYAVLAGPADDARSRLRADGFASVTSVASGAPAKIVTAGGWYEADGYAAARRALAAAKTALFAINDRLAQGVMRWCDEHRRPCPPIVGFDDAPIAERLNLTTIAIPWDELVVAAVRIVKRRLAGDRGTSSHQLINPRPVIRSVGSVRSR
jgi:hypothetical protein